MVYVTAILITVLSLFSLTYYNLSHIICAIVISLIAEQAGEKTKKLETNILTLLIGLATEARDVSSLHPPRGSDIPEAFLARLGHGGVHLGITRPGDCYRVVFETK